MKFNNRPNQCAKLHDGREVWLARDIAVATSALLVWQDRPHILVNQRGTGLPNFVGYWNLPCGYLDYDETTQEAAIREVWEECGVNLHPLIADAHALFFDQPWDVNSVPRGDRQNVTIHHGIVASVNELPPVSNVNNEPNETSDIRWLPLTEVNSLEFAFDHRPRISRFVEHVHKQSGLDFKAYLPPEA